MKRSDFANSKEVLITGLTGPDDYGQSTWTAHWLANNEWRGGSGVQSQVFAVSDFDVFRAQAEKRGETVRLCPEVVG